MKKLETILLLLLWVSALHAQSVPAPEIPYIEVTGSADMEVEPDEIHLSVTISGYKDGKSKEVISLESTEQRFMGILSKVGIKKNHIILLNASTLWYWYYWRIYDEEEFPQVTKQYEVVCSDYPQLNKILSELPGPKEGFLQVNISKLKNKDITEYRKQTKIEAIKAAKEKARYLLESVGNTPGKLLQIIELDEEDYGWYRPQGGISNTISQISLQGGGEGNDSDPSFQKIKLRYRIKARFEIQ